MRILVFGGLLAMSLAQAEVLPERDIQQIQAKVQAVCLKSDLQKNGWTAGELASVCNCKQTTMSAKLRTIQFSSISKPTQADFDMLQRAEEEARKECLKPVNEKTLVNSFVPRCVAKATSEPKLKSLNRDEQEARCTCAAKHVASHVDFDAIEQLDGTKRHAGIEAAWDAAFSACSVK